MKEMDRYEKLNEAYENAYNVCDPLEFANRQKKLTYAIAEFILHPYLTNISERVVNKIESDN